MAVPLADTREEAVNIAAAGVCVLLSTVVALSVVTIWTPEGARQAIGLTGASDILWMLPIGIASLGLYRLFSVWEIQRGDVPLVARTSLRQSFGQTGVQLAAGSAGLGAIGLVLGQIIGTSAGIGSLAKRWWQRDQDLIKHVTLRQLHAQVRHFGWFPMFSSSAALVSYSAWYLPPVLLAMQYGAQVAGWFALTQRLLGAPTSFIGNAVANVYAATAPGRLREDPAGVVRLFDRTATRLVLFGTAPILGIALLGPYFSGRIFGNQWAEAGNYLQILACLFAIRAVADPLGQTLTVLGRPAQQLRWDAVRLTGVIAVFGVAHRLGWTARTTLVLYGATTTLCYITLIFVSRRALTRYARGWRTSMRAV
jgi:O-antigen/teichoic acid export membrane protein